MDDNNVNLNKNQKPDQEKSINFGPDRIVGRESADKSEEQIKISVEEQPKKKILKDLSKSPAAQKKYFISKRGWLIFFIVFGILIIFGLIYIFIPKTEKGPSGGGLVNQGKLTTEQEFKKNYGEAWKIYYNKLTNIPNRIIGYYIDSLQINNEATVNKDNVDIIARKFMIKNNKLLNINNDDLKLYKLYEDESNRGVKEKIESIHYQQLYNKIPVHNSYTSFVFHNNKLVLYQSNYYPGISIDIQPKINVEEALGIIEQEANLTHSIATASVQQMYLKSFSPQAISAISQQQITKKIKVDDMKFKQTSLEIFPVKVENSYEYHLAWRVEYSLINDPLAKPVFYIDAHNGQILDRIDYIFYDNIDGVVSGQYYKKDTKDEQKSSTFENEDVAVESYTSTTSKNGYYQISNLLGEVELYSELKGPFVDVDNQAQYDAFHKADLAAPTKHDWNWRDSDTSYKQEESNVFYHVNFIHDYFKNADPFDIEEMDYPVKAVVSEKGSCNAYSDGDDIHFFADGNDCEATSLSADIIYHEYVHLITEHIYPKEFLAYTGESGALHEAFADYFSASILNKSSIGEGAFEKEVRNLNNKNRYSDDYINEVHYDSLISSGALWDLRSSLKSDETDGLLMRTMKTWPSIFQELLENLLLIDDNNGDLSDGTQNTTKICDAFYQEHGVYSDFCANYTSKSIADINSIKNGDQLKGKIDISGTANQAKDSEFKNFKIEYGAGDKPNTWDSQGITLVNDGSKNIINDKLAVFDTTYLEDGNYTIKLITESNKDKTENKWLVEIDNIEPAYLAGWPKSFSGVYNPMIVDTDKDGKNELAVLETVYPEAKAKLNFYNADGSYRSGLDISVNNLTGIGSYSIVDLNDDGNYEIIKTHQGFLDPTAGWKWEGLSVWDLKSGKLMWQTEEEPVLLGKGVSTLPVVADVDQGFEGKEIILGTGSSNAIGEKGGVSVIHTNGSIASGWPQAVDNNFGVTSSPAVGDIDHDSNLEIVAAGTENKVYAWHHDGTVVSGWPVDIGQNQIKSSPVLADLDGDGMLEIIVSLSLNEPTADNVYVFDHNGKIVKGWPKKTKCEVIRSSPAVGDINHDKKLEIVVGSGYNVTGLYSCSETDVYVFDAEGKILEGWPLSFNHRENIEFSPILVDVNSDEYSEIVISIENKIYAFDYKGQIINTWPARIVRGKIASNLVVGDLDGNGNLDLAIKNSISPERDKIYVWDIINGKFNPKNNEWPMFQFGNERTGVYGVCLDDGTKFNECNAAKQYCNNGILIFDCRKCDYKCPAKYKCQDDGSCKYMCKQTPQGEECPEIPYEY